MTMRPSTKSCLMLAALVGITVAGSPAKAAGFAPMQPGDEFRTLDLTTIDIAEGKQLAEKSCAACHGANGISTAPGTPHLAGQRPGYLYSELKAYQTGTRSDGGAHDGVKFVSNDALTKAAAYYAGLDPAAPPTASTRSAKPDPAEASKSIAATVCSGCHGNAGITESPGTPSLVGLDPQYLIAAMKAYKSGQRKNETMEPILAPLSDATINNIALLYALQPAEGAKTPAAGNQASGQRASAACAGCHGDHGVSGTSTTPSLAGQDAEYTVSALQAYRDGQRSDETMKGLAAALDDNAMKNLAAFFSAQKPKAPNVQRPLTTEEWAQRCDRCHGVNGNSINPRVPMLASQRADYLQKALKSFQERTRKSREMLAMSEGLGEDDIEALATHYARQKARVVLFVPVPSK